MNSFRVMFHTFMPQATLSDFRRSPAHRWNRGASPPAICLEFPLSTCPTYSKHMAGGEAPLFHRCADRKSTRLNSSHGYISYDVFCLKKKIPHISASTNRAAPSARDNPGSWAPHLRAANTNTTQTATTTVLCPSNVPIHSPQVTHSPS